MEKSQAAVAIVAILALAAVMRSCDVEETKFRTMIRQCIVTCSQNHPPSECRSACAPI